MKKSVLFRTALVMLVLTMVSSCFVGGTFAKYVTSDSGQDYARVAKFGVEVTVGGTTFAELYDTDDTRTDVVAAVGSKSVISTDADDDAVKGNVVAPGTKGDMASVTLIGAPEVAVEVKYEADLELSDWLIPDPNDETKATTKVYCPIDFEIGSTTITGRNYSNVAALETAVEEAIEGYSAQYAPNEDLSAKSVDIPVSWAWAFETSENKDYFDKCDTALGDKAASGTPDTITLDITVTVTQID